MVSIPVSIQPVRLPEVVEADDIVSRSSKTKAPVRVKTITMGCKVNHFESEYLAERLQADNYQRVSGQKKAELYIINTCTVTKEADRQARQLIRKIVKQDINAWIIVTGCYAERDAEACAAIPGVDLVVGNSQKLSIPALLDKLYQRQLPPIVLENIDEEISLPEQLLTGYEARSRAFLQIQQGCDQGCTFCIIHKVRGPNRSFDADMIERQFRRLVQNGFREIVICGVDVGSYGDDRDDTDLTELLTRLVNVEGEFRIRISSLDPAHITDALIDLMARHEKFCRQMHLSMQSGNTLILKRMKRRVTREKLYERIHALREKIPEMVLSADIIAGFPTEEQAHFQETFDAICDLEIAYPHVFAYSTREDTPAARIPRQVDKQEVKRRAALLRQQGEIVWQRVAERMVGRQLSVLIEKADDDGGYIARADNYFPVKIAAKNLNIGECYRCDISAWKTGYLIAASVV